jgi:hypothetical protein
MKWQAVAAIGMVLAFVGGHIGGARAKGPFAWDMPELVMTDFDGFDAYNRLVCVGMADLEAGRPNRAARRFERALAIPFHEAPNFELLPRLALAYWKAGRRALARQTLRKAHLALLISNGKMRCTVRPDGSLGMSFHGIGPMVIDEAEDIDTLDLMCRWPYGEDLQTKSTEARSEQMALLNVYKSAERAIHGKFAGMKCLHHGKWHAPVAAFLSKEKEWPPEDYCIQIIGLEKGRLAFSVLHLDDLSRPLPGGKSITVYLDPHRMMVIEILNSQ